MGTELPTRTLGRTGLEVTRLGFGAMELRDTPRSRPVSGEQAERVLNSVLDAGINFIDTSPDYGASEDRIGRYISHRRMSSTWRPNAAVTSHRMATRSETRGTAGLPISSARTSS